MTKRELRKIFKEKRNSISAAERARLDDLMLIQFQAVDLPFIYSLFTYWPMGHYNEPDTHLFTDYIEFRNRELKIAYPKIEIATGKMVAILIDEESAFKKNNFGTYEPEGTEIIMPDVFDMVFVPLLAFDLQGYRVGYGKGFYDRFLTDCRKDCLKVGFSYFEPVERITDKHEFDVPLNLCITPQSVYVF